MELDEVIWVTGRCRRLERFRMMFRAGFLKRLALRRDDGTISSFEVWSVLWPPALVTSTWAAGDPAR